MIAYVIEFAASFIEVYIAYGILEGIFCLNPDNKFRIRRSCLSLLLTVMIFAINRMVLFSYFPILVTVVWVGLTASKMYKIKIQYVVSIVSFYILCIYLLDFLCLSLVSLILQDDQFAFKIASGVGFTRSWFIILVKIVWVIGYFLVQKCILQRNKLRKMEFLMILSITGFLGVFFLIRETLKSLNIEIAAYWLGFTAVILLLLVSFYYYSEYKKEKEIIRMVQVRSDLMEKNYEAIREAYETNAKLFHDLNNHLNILYQLLKENDYDQAMDYIESLKVPLQNLKTSIWSGNKVVDSILNSKKNQAEKKAVRFEINAEFPQNTDIQSKDVVSILGNLLDNALEACKLASNEQEKWIQVSIRNINNMVVMKVQNSLFGRVQEENNQLKTTKEKSGMQGWGMRSVEAAAEKYDGTVQYFYTDKDFTVVVTLYYENL